MPLMSSRKAKLREGEGYNKELEEFANLVSEDLVNQARRLSKEAGAPFGAEKLTEDEQMARMDDWEDAAKYEKHVAAMTNGDLVKATLESVRKRKKWQEEGRWQRRGDLASPYDQAAPFGSPLAPPAADEAHADPNPGVMEQQMAEQAQQLGLPL